jgi:hypothetical protein
LPGHRHRARTAAAPAQHPHRLGDDIGWHNVSAYNQGVMGYRTPNIDRIAREGAMFDQVMQKIMEASGANR